jgi:hypothetical protein
VLVSTVIFVSLISAVSRASLNLFDRSMLKEGETSVFYVSLLNNLVPLIFILPYSVIAYDLSDFQILASANVWLIAASIQLNALLFGYGFKKLTVGEVALWSKIPDITLPFIFLLIGFQTSWVDLAFSLATTCMLAAFYFVFGTVSLKRRIGWVIFCAVTLHAVFSYILIQATASTLEQSILLSFCIIVIRSVYTLVLMLPHLFKRFVFVPLDGRMVLGRGFFALLTQVTFIYALSLGNPVLSWSIFNMTSLLSTLMAHYVLDEKPTRADYYVLASLTLIVSLRLYFN